MSFTRATYRSRGLTLVLIGLGLLAALYLIQLASPLRLDTDSAWYLRIGASIADGEGVHPPNVPSFPVGYPSFVAGLDILGLATPWALVALNLGFLAVGLAALRVTLRHGLQLEEMPSLVICALTLLSTLMVKHAVMALSEVVFFGLAAAAVAALTLAFEGRRRSYLVGGILLALAACTVRTAGVGLAPAIVLAFRSLRSRVVSGLVVVVGGGMAAATTPRYLDELSRGWDDGVLRSGRAEGHDLLELVGAAAANLPQSKLSSVSTPLIVIGTIVLILTIAALVTRRNRLAPIDGWVIGALVVLYVWPSDAARFMLPVFPFLLGYGALLARWWRRAAVVYATVFAALGLVAIALSTQITFSGRAFPERYAKGVLAPTYRVTWDMARPGDRARVDPSVLLALRRFGADPPGR